MTDRRGRRGGANGSGGSKSNSSGAKSRQRGSQAGARIGCEFCDRDYANDRNLERHVEREHPDEWPAWSSRRAAESGGARADSGTQSGEPSSPPGDDGSPSNVVHLHLVPAAPDEATGAPAARTVDPYGQELGAVASALERSLQVLELRRSDAWLVETVRNLADALDSPRLLLDPGKRAGLSRALAERMDELGKRAVGDLGDSEDDWTNVGS